MNNNQLFDNNIKEEFKNYQPEVPPHIWENIVKQRESKKPVGFWFNFFNGRNMFLLAALFLATGTAAYFLLKRADLSNKNFTAATAAPKNVQEITSTKNITPQEKEKNNGSINKPEEALHKKATNIPGTNNPGMANANSLPLKKNHTLFSLYGQVDTDENLKHHKNIITDTDDGNVAKNLIYITTVSTEDNYLKRILFYDVQRMESEKQAAQLQKRNLFNINLPGCPDVEKDAAGNKTYLEVYGGPDIAFSNLSDTGNSTYLQKRKESIKFSSAFSAGLRYTRVFNNGMSVRTGVNYSQINEKFTFVQGNLVQVTYIIDANGDTTGSYVTTGTRYKTTYNKFKTIDVPLLIGYEMGNGKFHANINAGVIVNVYSWQKGEVLDANYQPVSITTGKTNSAYRYKTNTGLGFMAGASLYYKLNEKFHLLAEPYFRYNLTPMSDEKLTFKQKYNTAGLRLGVRLDLQ